VALTFKMLVRILPTNVEPYLKGFRTNVTTHANSEAIRRLALDHDAAHQRPERLHLAGVGPG
jgi:hypothetical protein